MPTQEERLAALEAWRDSFKDDERTPLRRIHEDLTIMLALYKEQTPQVKAQWRDVHEMGIRIDKLENHAEALQSDVSQSASRLAHIEQRLDRVETQLKEHTILLTQILTRLPEHPS